MANIEPATNTSRRKSAEADVNPIIRVRDIVV
jgi:hypothetical protein